MVNFTPVLLRSLWLVNTVDNKAKNCTINPYLFCTNPVTVWGHLSLFLTCKMFWMLWKNTLNHYTTCTVESVLTSDAWWFGTPAALRPRRNYCSLVSSWLLSVTLVPPLPLPLPRLEDIYSIRLLRRARMTRDDPVSPRTLSFLPSGRVRVLRNRRTASSPRLWRDCCKKHDLPHINPANLLANTFRILFKYFWSSHKSLFFQILHDKASLLIGN